jgi:hypothetical protein
LWGKNPRDFNKAILRDGNGNMAADLEREMERAAELIPQGGYIPFADHFIPYDVSFKNFSRYRKMLQEIISSTPVLIG